MAVNTSPIYPSEYEAEVKLRDGSRMLLRPIKKDDTQKWLAFLSRMSIHSRYLRFHNVPREMNLEDAVRSCTVDYKDTFAIVAESARGKWQDIVGVARYYRLSNRRSAEIALAVEDDFQGKGLGTRLLYSLVNIALDNDITRFEADILADNEQMLSVLRDSGFHIASELQAGVYHVNFPIDSGDMVTEDRKNKDRKI